jgi:hypothetical protein
VAPIGGGGMKTTERQRAANRAYYRAHRETLLAREKARYQANRPAIEARRRALDNARRAADPDGYAAASRARYQRERDVRLERARAKRVAQPNADRLRDHGLTDAEYDALLASQGGLCAICRGGFGSPGDRIDHDHDTGRVRGLLCHNCNVALGHFRDDPLILARAAAYVRASREDLRRAA